jgi:hypothetical protein
MSQAASPSIAQIRARCLHQHFFRRFFDNDTLSSAGDTQASVVRALCLCAVPGLMVAFWLLPSYPGKQTWAVAADRYFFVLYSFVAMGIVTTFEWEMLFPDRADFLILLPLPIKARQLFYAKARALLTFLLLFLGATNIFSLVLFPAVSTARHSNYFRSVAAHSAAVLLSGTFAAFSMLAIEGLCICLLPDAWQRWISPILQSLSITVLLLLLFLFPLFGSHMQNLLEGNSQFAQFIPPLWFLGLYEHLALGNLAPAGAQSLATIGLCATVSALALALIAYPLAWSRQQRRALEGASQKRSRGNMLLTNLLHRTLLAKPQERAVFHFIGHTLRRNSRYQVYLAIYSGVGLALASASIVTLRLTSAHTLQLALSNLGLHAVLPLLLFWLAVGLRVAFAFPIDMAARWVFPINLLQADAHAKATRIWVTLCCSLLTCCVLVFLFALHWSAGSLALQAIWGAVLSLLLADIFFFNGSRIPFTQPRLPARASLPITLVLYAAAFPVFVLLTVHLEILSETRLSILLRIILSIAALHLLLKMGHKFTQTPVLTGFSLEEADDEFQTLGLSS